MPTYAYKCKSCLHEFEQFQKFSEDTLVKCPSCGKDTLVRLIGGAGLAFKGSGFYITDYKKTGTSPGSIAGEKKESTGEKKESKTETKTDSKPESPKTESPKSESPKESSSKSDKGDSTPKK